jgi:hypothetical protein
VDFTLRFVTFRFVAVIIEIGRKGTLTPANLLRLPPHQTASRLAVAFAAQFLRHPSFLRCVVYLMRFEVVAGAFSYLSLSLGKFFNRCSHGK